MSEIIEETPNQEADDIATKIIEILVNKFKEKVLFSFFTSISYLIVFYYCCFLDRK